MCKDSSNVFRPPRDHKALQTHLVHGLEWIPGLISTTGSFRAGVSNSFGCWISPEKKPGNSCPRGNEQMVEMIQKRRDWPREDDDDDDEGKKEDEDRGEEGIGNEDNEGEKNNNIYGLGKGTVDLRGEG
ncbi:hypothetical protein Y1Q_0000454 [Alligator mississippiensis]|uniref:Uncharacterized protein n=1 Tax=Alligator mississippiensis TaxID=8496 RepID=A0A151MB37_ALLMI|nr:hypothetical protein Y1Q_0000454 [Alligator mississippiensis]